jgi:uncharacterized phiE125 gp8 family phage protein
MGYRKKMITDVATEVVTLEEVKNRLHILDNFSDSDLGVLIPALRGALQDKLQRAVGVQTWQLALDEFQDAIELPLPPLLSVVDIQYVDTTGVLRTLSSTEYAVDTFSEPGFVVPKTSWPATYDTINAVLVKFTCGFSPSFLPPALKMWLFANIGHFHANREVFDANQTSDRTIVDGLLDTHRVFD